jgi:non-specific serine/threonine protein kinase
VLETIREFGLERLAEAGEEDPVRTAHAVWCLALAERAEPAMKGPDHEEWWARLEADHDNLRVALDWSAAAGAAGAERSLRLGGALARFWMMRGTPREGRIRLDAALAAARGASPAVRAKATIGAAELAWAQGDFAPAIALAEASLSLWRDLGDPAGKARAVNLLAIVAHALGDYPRATARYEEALALRRGLGDRLGVANVLSNLGGALYYWGELDRADEVLAEAVALARESESAYEVAGALFFRAGIARARGDIALAAALCQESLTLKWQLGARRFVAEYLRPLVGIWAAAGEPARAARLAGAEAALREAIDTPVDPPEELARYEQDVAAARAALGEAPFAAAEAEGRVLPLEEAVAEALAPIPAVPTATDMVTAAASRPPHGLSAREMEVLRLVAEGLPDHAIADALFISRRTVTTHVSNIFAKLGLDSRAAVAAYAVRHGLA